LVEPSVIAHELACPVGGQLGIHTHMLSAGAKSAAVTGFTPAPVASTNTRLRRVPVGPSDELSVSDEDL